MTAEEYLKDRFIIHDKTIYDGDNLFDFNTTVFVMEAYLKAKVKEELIKYDQWLDNGVSDTINTAMVDEYLEEQLLKQ